MHLEGGQSDVSLSPVVDPDTSSTPRGSSLQVGGAVEALQHVLVLRSLWTLARLCLLICKMGLFVPSSRLC